MNGTIKNVRQVDLSNVRDIQFNGISLINSAKIAELKDTLEKGLDNLLNYYNKENTYSKTEINNLFANKAVYNIVESLPTQNISLSTIYLVKKAVDNNTTDDNAYDEYLYINDKWEFIGSLEVDLSNYYSKEEVDTLLNNKESNINNSITQLERFITSINNQIGSINDAIDLINGEVI